MAQGYCVIPCIEVDKVVLPEKAIGVTRSTVILFSEQLNLARLLWLLKTFLVRFD